MNTMLTNLWQPILSVLVIGIVSYQWHRISARKRKIASDEKLLRKKTLQDMRRRRLAEAENHRKKCLATGAEEAISFACDQIIKADTIIDSNIWMNDAYDDFFFLLGESCRRKGQPFSLFSSQLDRLFELRRAEDRDTCLGAQLAVKRIEAFQKADLLRIVPTARESAMSAASESPIIRLVFAAASKNRSVCFVTDDVERRIRVRKIMQDRSRNDIHILDIADTLPLAAKFASAVKEGLVETASASRRETPTELKIVPITAFRNTA